MGILDDAIREHLELKRAHGATDDEIARKEAEAFGPARQEPAGDATALMPEAEFAEPDLDPEIALSHDADFAPEPEPLEPGAAFDEAFADEPAAFEAPPAQPAPDPAAFQPPAEPAPEPAAFEPAAPPPPAEPVHPSAGPLDQPAEAFDPFAGEPTPADDPPPVPIRPFDTDEHVAPEPVFGHADRPAPVEEPPVEDPPVEEPPVEEPPVREAGEEDVLEETPEFLQDTPEHDRLWFEQKPPRDFDFGN